VARGFRKAAGLDLEVAAEDNDRVPEQVGHLPGQSGQILVAEEELVQFLLEEQGTLEIHALAVDDLLIEREDDVPITDVVGQDQKRQAHLIGNVHDLLRQAARIAGRVEDGQSRGPALVELADEGDLVLDVVAVGVEGGEPELVAAEPHVRVGNLDDADVADDAVQARPPADEAGVLETVETQRLEYRQGHPGSPPRSLHLLAKTAQPFYLRPPARLHSRRRARVSSRPTT